MKTMTIATLTAAFLMLAMTGPALGDPPARPTVEVLFARQVQDRKPVDPATTFSPGKLYCWTRLTSRENNYLIAHHWLKNGRRVWHQPIEVRGKQWVTWSQFKVTPGSWTVRVTDEAGLVLHSAGFTVQ